MANIMKFGGSGSGGSSSITAPIIGKDFTWTGSDNSYLVLNDGDNNWRIKFLTSGIFTPLRSMSIDLFLVGGGGGSDNSASTPCTAAGAGGGYTLTIKSIKLLANTEYSIVVGAGGSGTAGGSSSAFGHSAKGGKSGEVGATNPLEGGLGGSGGGEKTASKAYDGGSDGSDGGKDQYDLGGDGQGTTTREFGEETGDLYSGGGGAYGNNSTIGNGGAGGGANGWESASANTGGGAGGAKRESITTGGSGIVIIRNSRS